MWRSTATEGTEEVSDDAERRKQLYQVFSEAAKQYGTEGRVESMKKLGRMVANLVHQYSLTRMALYVLLSKNKHMPEFCAAVREEVRTCFGKENVEMFQRLLHTSQTGFDNYDSCQKLFVENMMTVLGTTRFQLNPQGDGMSEVVPEQGRAADLSTCFAQCMLCVKTLLKWGQKFEHGFLLPELNRCQQLIGISLCEAAHNPLVAECLDALRLAVSSNQWQWPKDLPGFCGDEADRVTMQVLPHADREDCKFLRSLLGIKTTNPSFRKPQKKI